MKDILTLNLNLTLYYEMGADNMSEDMEFTEEDYEFDKQSLINNLCNLIKLGLREGLFTEDTFAYLQDHKIRITEETY